MDAQTDRSTPALVGDLLKQVTDLIRKEIALLRAEIGEKTNQAFTAVGMIVGGVVMALVALNVLAAALVSAVAEAGIAPGWAALIVGGGIALIALILVMTGSKNLKASSLAPDRTARSVQKDATLAKESYK